MSWWLYAAQAASTVMSSLMGGKLESEQAKSANRISESNRITDSRMRRAKNWETAAKNNLARYVQSANSNRALDDVGNELEATTLTHLRNRDQRQQQGLLMDLNSVEELGAAMASQGFHGVGGSVADTINATTSLRNSITKQLAMRETQQVEYDYSRRRSTITQQLFAAPDSSVIIDELDFTQQAAVQQAVGSKSTALFKGLLSSMQNGSLQGTISNMPSMSSLFSSSSGSYSLGPAKFGDMAAESTSPFSLSNSKARFGWSSTGASLKI